MMTYHLMKKKHSCVCNICKQYSFRSNKYYSQISLYDCSYEYTNELDM